MRRPPLVIIDECLPAEPFRAFLTARGHQEATVGEAFPNGAPDEAILKVAELEHALVLTMDRDWEHLLKRVTGHRGRVRSAGRITFRCAHPVALRRLQSLIEFLEREYDDAERSGRRFLVTITSERVTIDR